MKIHEQIAALRRQKQITQEELAIALGVTNQAVSKWENGQCCPDIGLLPKLAAYFEVTVDQLMGLSPVKAETQEDAFHRVIFDLSEDKETMLHAVLAMHAAFIVKHRGPVPLDDGAVDAVIDGSWGYSAFTEDDITTVMRGQSVFYSKNQALDFTPKRIDAICGLMERLSDKKHLSVFCATYELCRTEDEYVAVEPIAEWCLLPAAEVKCMLEGPLCHLIEEKNGMYHVLGEASMILPILSLLTY